VKNLQIQITASHYAVIR